MIPNVRSTLFLCYPCEMFWKSSELAYQFWYDESDNLADVTPVLECPVCQFSLKASSIVATVPGAVLDGHVEIALERLFDDVDETKGVGADSANAVTDCGDR